MKVLRNKNNMVILENNKEIILISYNSIVAKVCNYVDLSNIENSKEKYGLFLGTNWDYSQTTLKQVYEFIEDYSTQRDENDNMFAYQLGQEKNKKEYIKKQIANGNIKLLKESEF